MALLYIPACAFLGWFIALITLAVGWDDTENPMLKFTGIGALIGLVLCVGSVYYDTTPEGIAHAAAERAQEQADLQPRVIREFDGCKVYAFKGGGQWHYITRCPDRTVTERNYTEQHGKITEHKTETTTTENH